MTFAPRPAQPITADLSAAERSRLFGDPRVQLLCQVVARRFPLYVVGGAPRDILHATSLDFNFDLDLATPLRPEQIVAECQALGIRTVRISTAHQTVALLWDGLLSTPGLKPVEITTFRGAGMTPEQGGAYSDSIETDLAFRDFTINALAIELPTGRLIDPTGGRSDIEARVIRAVGDAATRFLEDPLRILRMVRFLSTLEFEIETATLAAANRLLPELARVSIERVREEFLKTLLGSNVTQALWHLQKLGFFREFLPELEVCVAFEQNSYHLADLFTHTLEVVRRSPAEPVSRLGALLHDIGKVPTLSIDEAGERHFYRHESVGAEMTKAILQRFKCSHELTDAVTALVALHMRPLDAGDAGLRRLLRDLGDYYPQWRALKEADSLSCKLESATVHQQFLDFDQRINEIRARPSLSPLSALMVRGEDIMALGISEGPRVGEILRYLHERVIDNPELNLRETLLALAAEYNKGSKP